MKGEKELRRLPYRQKTSLKNACQKTSLKDGCLKFTIRLLS